MPRVTPQVTDFARLLTALDDAAVRFIVVGGAAATAHGSARLTLDLDVVYERSSDNIGRLVAALTPLHPYLRGAPSGLPFVFDVATVSRGLNFTLITDAGWIDVLGEITGGGAYQQLLPHAIELTLFGRTTRVLDLERLIYVKRAAGRPRDHDALAELEVLFEERDRAR
jgi:predicted nucleotidyltransferase